MNSNELFIALKKRRNVWLLPGFTLVFSLVSFIFVVIPQAQTALSIRENKSMLTADLEKYASKRLSLSQTSTATLDEQLQSLEYVLPLRKPVLELLTLLESFSLDTEVVLRGYEFNPGQLASESAQLAQEQEQVQEQDEAGAKTMTVALEVEGTFDAIQSFYERIENMGPLSQLGVVSQSVFIDPYGAETSELQEAKITLNVQYAPNPDGLGDIESDEVELSGENMNTLDKTKTLQTVADIEDQAAEYVAPSIDRPNPFSY